MKPMSSECECLVLYLSDQLSHNTPFPETSLLICRPHRFHVIVWVDFLFYFLFYPVQMYPAFGDVDMSDFGPVIYDGLRLFSSRLCLIARGMDPLCSPIILSPSPSI